MTPAQLKSDFETIFPTSATSAGSGPVRVVRAPGRVNLIGEHTDYNDGFVFPMAIEPQVLFAARARTDQKVVAVSTLFPQTRVEFDLAGPITPGKPSWGNYVRGPAAELLTAGIPLVGMDVLIANTLPPGGGLSSSAAMEVGTITSLLALAGTELAAGRIALLAQKAEHDYAGVPCGIMDQTIVAAGRAGHAMLLDCRNYKQTFIPISPADLRVVVVNSMVKHELSGGEYGERRSQCEQGVAYFQKQNPAVKALRDVTAIEMETAKSRLSDVVFRRCRHVVGEIARCLAFAKHLQAEAYDQAGKLMMQSHNSLRDDYEVSTPELDFLVETAVGLKGVYGSRMTGGGFGGCTVSLVQPRHADQFEADIRAAFKKKYDIDPVVFSTNATDGAGVLE